MYSAVLLRGRDYPNFISVVLARRADKVVESVWAVGWVQNCLRRGFKPQVCLALEYERVCPAEGAIGPIFAALTEL